MCNDVWSDAQIWHYADGENVEVAVCEIIIDPVMYLECGRCNVDPGNIPLLGELSYV